MPSFESAACAGAAAAKAPRSTNGPSLARSPRITRLVLTRIVTTLREICRRPETDRPPHLGMALRSGPTWCNDVVQRHLWPYQPASPAKRKAPQIGPIYKG